MACFGEVALYEKTKVALAKITEGSASNGPVIQFSTRSGEALEDFLDLLELDSQPEVIACESETGFVDVATSTPLAACMCEFAIALREGELTPIEEQVLGSQCTFLVSLPDRLANALLSTSMDQKCLGIDLDILTTRLCQALFSFLFAVHKTELGESVEVLHGKRRYRFLKKSACIVCDTMLQSMVRRGYIKTVFHCFVRFVRTAAPTLMISEEIMPLVYKAIFKSSFNGRWMPRGSMENAVVERNGSNLSWSEWNSWFLREAEKDFEIKSLLVDSLVQMLTLQNKGCEGADDMMCMSQALEREIFFTETSALPNERGVLRIIFRKILPIILSHRNEERLNGISAMEEKIFTEIFQQWGSSDIVEKGSIQLNTTLANAVLYVLLHIKERSAEKGKNRLPHVLLQSLLSGISVRFGCVRTTGMRDESITVASAFASFFVSDSEAAHAFSDLGQFPALLDDWLKDESQPTGMPGMSHVTSTDTRENVGNDAHIIFVRRSLKDEEYPLNPDSAFTFFCRRNSTVPIRSSLPEKGAVLFNPESIVNHGQLLSFGKTSHDEDELDDNISVLTTVRESYNAIMGIGRSTGAQLYEIQQEIESGLRGFSLSLQSLKDKLGVWKEKTLDGAMLPSRERVGRELDPMVSSLLPALMSLTIHAPEERCNELMNLRYSVLVSLIILTPEHALEQLGKMVYSSHYGVHQRVEMAKAIGEAARYLSKIEIHATSQAKTQWDTNQKEDSVSKRIYPPIRSGSKKHVAIIATEGKETRRWGNAVAGRGGPKSKIYTNYLSEVVNFFVSALLKRAEDEHFAFFRDNDPYAPSEVLKSLGIVVQCIASSRHVAPALCESIFSFALIVVTQHPLSVVRRQGWILIGEVMRSWCGAGPLVPNDDSSAVSRSVFGGSLSYTFSEDWLQAQQVLAAASKKVQEDSSCVDVAFLVLADLQDLVLAKQAVEIMETRVIDAKRIYVTDVRDNAA